MIPWLLEGLSARLCWARKWSSNWCNGCSTRRRSSRTPAVYSRASSVKASLSVVALLAHGIHLADFSNSHSPAPVLAGGDNVGYAHSAIPGALPLRTWPPCPSPGQPWRGHRRITPCRCLRRNRRGRALPRPLGLRLGLPTSLRLPPPWRRSQRPRRRPRCWRRRRSTPTAARMQR